MTPDRDNSVLEESALMFCDVLDIDTLLVDVDATASVYSDSFVVLSVLEKLLFGGSVRNNYEESRL